MLCNSCLARLEKGPSLVKYFQAKVLKETRDEWSKETDEGEFACELCHNMTYKIKMEVIISL